MKAALFIIEHQRLARSGRLYYLARRMPGVVAAFPTIGRFDGVVFIDAPHEHTLNDIVVRVSKLPGVHSTNLHAERPKARKRPTNR